MSDGYIYVLSNDSMPGLYKIGVTNRSVGERIKELSSSTGVPLPFKEEYSYYVPNIAEAEIKIHSKLKDFRLSESKEFFKADEDTIYNAFGELFFSYYDYIHKVSESYNTIGSIYFSNNYTKFLNSNKKTIIEDKNYDLAGYGDIFKKNGKYYYAACYCEVCTEEEYESWLNDSKNSFNNILQIALYTKMT